MILNIDPAYQLLYIPNISPYWYNGNNHRLLFPIRNTESLTMKSEYTYIILNQFKNS